MSNVTCFNIFGANPREDERHYARDVAAQAQADLREVDRDAGRVQWDKRMLSVPLSPKPQLQTLIYLLDLESINSIAVEVGADAVWTGQGGDHLFWEERNPLGAADYLLRRGVGYGLFKVLAEAARLSRMSYLSVLQTAIAEARSRESWAVAKILSAAKCFVNEDALPRNLVEYVAPPWMSTTPGVPPGKQAQIYYLADALNRHRPFPGLEFTTQHHPLLSQPLVDLCLQIPTYILLRGGRPRGLAREAFVGLVPQKVLDRHDKGDISFTATDLIRNSESFIRELLGDGVLVRSHILDRNAVDQCIRDRRPVRVEQLRPLIACIAAEIWARSWNDSAVRIAA
jgi:asparagine synthase (glutamine-hydrolysing)